jgi:hypothetical protein
MSEIIHRIKLRLSRSSKTPSDEEEERGTGGEEEEEEREADDDDFDPSHCHRYIFRCQQNEGGSKLFQTKGHNGETLNLWACDNINASRWG